MSRVKWNDNKLLFRLKNNKTDRTYWDNITELRKRASNELFSKCVKLTKSKIEKERMIGIDMLAQLSSKGNIRPFSKKVIEIYLDLLKKEKTPLNLMSILYGIGHNNENITTDEQVNLIASFQNHNEDCVREGVTSALSGLESKMAIETLISLCEDKRSYIRDWATFGIGNLLDIDNDNIRKCLWKRVNDKHQDTKLEAILGLAKRKDKAIKTFIVRELLDGEFGTLLFEAIEELNDKSLVPILEEQLQKSEKNKNINPEWIKDLRDCLDKLKNGSVKLLK